MSTNQKWVQTRIAMRTRWTLHIQEHSFFYTVDWKSEYQNKNQGPISHLHNMENQLNYCRFTLFLYYATMYYGQDMKLCNSAACVEHWSGYQDLQQEIMSFYLILKTNKKYRIMQILFWFKIYIARLQLLALYGNLWRVEFRKNSKLCTEFKTKSNISYTFVQLHILNVT